MGSVFDHAKIQNTEGYFAIPRKTGNVPVLFKIELEEKRVMRQCKVPRVPLDFIFQLQKYFAVLCVCSVLSSNA